MPRPELSLVIPVQDQEAALPQLDARLQQLLTTLSTSTEVLFVEDGSVDQSLAILRGFAAREPRYRVLSLSRRFGYERALAAGMDKARGQGVIVLDPEVTDLDDVVSALLAKWHEGYDVVYGRRRQRFGESTFNIQVNRLFDWIFSAITPIDVPRGTGNVRLVNRRVVATMRGLNETHRFVRGLVAWVGFKQASVEYDAAEPASRGATVFQRLSTAVDLITSFSATPLRLAASVATFACIFSFLFGFLALVSHGPTTPPGWTSLVVLGSVVSGLTFFILGILGAYVARLYEQSKRRPLYVVSERINFKPQREQKLSTSDFAEVTAPLVPAALPPIPAVTMPIAAVAPPAPTPAVPPVTATSRVSASSFPRPLPSTPPPSFSPPASIRPRSASSATLASHTSQPPPAPSVPPPRVGAPSIPGVKTAAPAPRPTPSTAPPAVTPSTPPVSKAPSIAPPPTTRSVPPVSKAPTSKAPPALTPSAPSVKTASVPPKSVSAPPAPKPNPSPLKETQRSAAAKPGAVSDPKKLFGGETSPVERKQESIKPPRVVPSVMPKPIEEDDDHTIIQSHDPLGGKSES